MRTIGTRCTHRRAPGSRLVGAGDADADVARCSLIITFFLNVACYDSGKERLNNRGAASFSKIRYCHIIITPILLLGRLLKRRNYRSIIVSHVNHHNISPP